MAGSGGLACGWWPFCDIWTPFGFCVLFVFGLFSFVIVVVILIYFFFGGHFVARPPFCFGVFFPLFIVC